MLQVIKSLRPSVSFFLTLILDTALEPVVLY